MLYKKNATVAKEMTLVADEMILTADMPTTAGSRMLDGYRSLFSSEALLRLAGAGYELVGKVNVGEFGIDLLGESCYYGATERDGALALPAAAAIADGEAAAALVLDVNGAPTRGAAALGLTYVKPTYGTVSRYGVVPAACSGDTVGVIAACAEDCRRVLLAMAGHDDKDGTSLADDACRAAAESGKAPIARVALATSLLDGVDAEMRAEVMATADALRRVGVEVVEVDAPLLAAAHEAWSILMSAEVCNNVSRYDGVKFGYRADSFTSIDELYTNSRTEAFGELLKLCILYGSDTLSTENYSKVYDKALRVRRVVAEAFDALFAEYGAVLLPTASKRRFGAEEAKAAPLAYRENRFTAPAMIAGLPSVVTQGVALVGAAFSEGALLDLAARLEKEAKA